MDEPASGSTAAVGAPKHSQKRVTLRPWVVLVALQELVGGAIGVWYTLGNPVWFSRPGSCSVHVGLLPLGIWLFFLLVFGASAIAGFLLLIARPAGVLLSVWIQALQVPSFFVAGFRYWFVVGLALGVKAVPGDVGLFWYLGAKWAVALGSASENLALSVNVMALACAIALARMYRSGSGARCVAVAQQADEPVNAHGR